jgi:hypothetical protein
VIDGLLKVVLLDYRGNLILPRFLCLINRGLGGLLLMVKTMTPC